MKSAKNGYDAKYENVFKDHGGLPVNSQVLESDPLVCVCILFYSICKCCHISTKPH